MSSGALLLRRIATLLPRYAYRFTDESALHDGIAHVLSGAGIEFEHEHVAGPKDRFDFLCAPGIVIEAKIKGSIGPALTQCARYAARDDVAGVVLATTRAWGSARDLSQITTLRGKPVWMIHLRRQSF